MIYCPPEFDFAAVSQQLTDYCNSHGYMIVSIDRDGKPWRDTLANALATGVDVILAAHIDHVPSDRTPRLEIADLSVDHPGMPTQQGPPRARRPRPV